MTEDAHTRGERTGNEPTRNARAAGAAEPVRETSRRTVLKRGALVSGGLALGLPDAAGTVAGQDDGNGDAPTALLQPGSFHPDARLRIVSAPLDWTPGGDDSAAPRDHGTRVARYANTNERVLLHPIGGASIDPSARYRVSRNVSFVETGRFVRVTLLPVGNGTTAEGERTGESTGASENS